MVHKKRDPRLEGAAMERIIQLHELAKGMKPSDPVLAKRYIQLSEKIAERMDITIPPRIKRSYCKNCGLPYDRDTRIRIKNGICTVACSNCGDIRRLPYKY
ncbi:MAG: ribonuclease P [Candidatus Thermoplasmatota archaeon]|jgi:ribonuclease P protein subunit RPR2|nr:ribonuclease P [Candidatus Thermoplasmatota archaeon]